VAPPGRALLASLVVREPDGLLALRGGLAVADLAGPSARVKWPNDVLLDGRKVAGVLAEGRPQEGWAVLGIGVNVAVDPQTLPRDVRDRAGTLARPVGEVESALTELLAALTARLAEPATAVVAELRRRDALLGQRVRWADGSGTGAGIDPDGRLIVRDDAGREHPLEAGEVHLLSAAPAGSE
jgi:BirA family biotin operon repressor/biotin-[acetyl-CoA-carboxylase] ligase